MRRTWTLLLVAVLLAVFLAVPAMASEEEHTSHTGWDKLTASTTLKDGGKYYLEGDLTASFTVTEGEITVCLNGKAWSGDGTRPLAVTGGTVNICDCKHTGADADTGAIVGATLASSLGGGVVDGKFNGGAVTVTSGTVNFYSGIIRDGTGGSGGNVAVNGANSEFNMHGGIIRGGRTLDDNVYHGGNVRLSNEAVFNLYDGLVTGGEAKNGGGNFVLVGTATKLNIYGGTITDGTAKGTGDPGGGNIYIHEGTVTMEAGTVSGGTSKYMGGNVYLRNGTFHMKSGVVSGGTAKDPASAPNIYVNHGGAEVTLERDARVYGGMDAANAMTVTLKGTPIVDKALTTEGQSPAYSLRLASGRLLTLDGLKAGARVGITGASPATGVVICNAVGTSDYSGIRYDTDAFYIRKTADAKLDLAAAAEVTGAAVNHGSIVYSLEEAVTLAGKGGYVRLVNSLTGPTISQSVSVDLNGYDITNLTLAENACLTLFDSSTADYEVEVDETSSNGYSGYGTVTLADGSPANILRQGNTSKDTYGYNYRFVAVKDGEGYHAHRIYLTVKSTILYPNKPALTYRTALRCDQLVAAYINAAGGGFGILASAEELGKSYGDYTDNGYEVLPWNSKTGEQNERVTYLNEILEDPDATAENTLRATTKVRAQAYIFLADAFYGSRLAAGTDDVAKATNAALITDEAVTSSGVSQSLQNMVELAFAKSPATLSSVTRDAMCDMYTKWSTNLMETWSLQYLQDYMDGYDGMTLKYGCLCGKPSSKDNPCAAGGHVQLTWSPWDSSTNNFPSESGNYYLTEPLVLKNQGKVDEDVFINLNTNGHNISVEGKVRASLVHGVLNLTNFGYDGAAVAEVRVTATCNMDGNGGVLLIAEAGNVSLYSGVTLAAQANHNITKGVVGVAGDLNIYGGRIEGTTLKTVDKE